MSWTAIIVVALVGVGLAALAIVLIENHRRFATIFVRWEFVLWVLFGAQMASSSWDHWVRGETTMGIVTAVIAGGLLCVAVVTFRNAGRVAPAAARSGHDRPDH